MKTLVIFDFDDTLFKSGAHVIVRSPEGGTRHLTTREFAQFSHSDKDHFDFSQFEIYPPDPQPIPETVGKLAQAVSKYGVDNVIVLTARAKSQPIDEVLRNFSLPQVYVAALADANAAAKATFVLDTVTEESYDSVIVFEDSARNIDAIRNAVVPVINEKNFSAFLVVQNKQKHSLVRH